MKRVISTDDAPAAVGAYSQATSHAGLLFTAGQIPMTPAGELLNGEPIDVQTEQCLENLRGILAENSATFTDVLKATIFLGDIDDFESMNQTYGEYFDDTPPARSAFAVKNLPKGVDVEIEMIAALE